MYRAFGAAALLTIAIAGPVQEAAAQDPVGGALLGGAGGAIVGGALGGGRGAAVGAVVGGVTGAAIAAQGQPKPGGYRYYQQACYQQRGDGAWVAVAPQYCAPAAAARAPEVMSPVRSAPNNDDLDIPAMFDRRPLSAQENEHLADVMAKWSQAKALKIALTNGSDLVRERFLSELRRWLSSLRTNPGAGLH